jgi:hypothetical protein
MPVRIKTRKLVIKGVPYRMITGIEALQEHELPKKYISGFPCMVKGNPSKIDGIDIDDKYATLSIAFDPRKHPEEYKILFDEEEETVHKDLCAGVHVVSNDKPVTEEIFQSIISLAKACGKRLSEINEQEALRKWKGRETVVI